VRQALHFLLHQVVKLLHAKALQRLAVDEKGRRLATAESLDVSSVLARDVDDLGRLHVAASVSATPIVEAPWLPLPAAYRTSLFLANLTPTPWSTIAETWAAAGTATGGAAIDRARAAAGDEAAAAIEAASANKDAQSLFEAVTRMVAAAVIERLERAEATMGDPPAQLLVDEGKAFYRAFADGIRAADPGEAHKLGRAWLDLSSAVGSAGLF
ncbi:MAG: hypothetical protein RIM80_12965, partial [Alphaproteobacteria bacterium]